MSVIKTLLLILILFISCVDKKTSLKIDSQESEQKSVGKKLVTVLCEEFPPHTGKKLKNLGWTVDVLRESLNAEGYKLKYDLITWARAVEWTKSGKKDGLFLAYLTEERKNFYYFSDVIGKVNVGLLSLKEKNISYKKIEDLKSFDIGVIRKAAHSEQFDKANYLKKINLSEYPQGLKMLYKGRIDLFAGPKKLILHEINLLKNNPVFLKLIKNNPVKFLEPPLKINNMYLAISQKAPFAKEKLEAFNRGLKKIKANGIYSRILKDHGF